MQEQLKQLFDEFTFLSSQSYKGVPGVIVFDSGKPGPTVGITAMTHGNEIAGLATIKHFRVTQPLTDRLKNGRVICVVNNMGATKRYFNTVQQGGTEDEGIRQGRFIDHNMNRLPEDLMTNNSNQEYEMQRARELQPVWGEFDFALDIHSVTSGNFSSIIDTGESFDAQLILGFPIDTIYTNISKVQIGKAASYFYGTPGTVKSLAIEAGQHTNETALKNAIACSLVFLKNLCMVDDAPITDIREYTEYKVIDSLIVPNDSYNLTRVVKFYEQITAGEIIATGNGEDVHVPCDGIVLMPPRDRKPKNFREEVFFIAEPPKTIRR